MEDEREIVVAAGSGDREAAERCRMMIGTGARVLIVDDAGDWHDITDVRPPSDVLWCGLDLARGTDIHLAAGMTDLRIMMPRSAELMVPVRRTHPTTARERRRAERGRRR